MAGPKGEPVAAAGTGAFTRAPHPGQVQAKRR